MSDGLKMAPQGHTVDRTSGEGLTVDRTSGGDSQWTGLLRRDSGSLSAFTNL